jgi:hypothetical protein
MSELTRLLSQCCTQIASVQSIGLFDLHARRTLAFLSPTSQEESRFAGLVLPMARLHERAATLLEDSSSSSQILFSTEEGSLLFHFFSGEKQEPYLLVLSIGAASNPTMARLRLQSYERTFLEMLQAAPAT